MKPEINKYNVIMKTSSLLLGAAITAFAFASMAAEPLLSPRATDNQIKQISGQTTTPGIRISHVDTQPALLSPRAAGNQSIAVKGTDTGSNPIFVCRETMKGAPKAVAECTSHANMPGCVGSMR